MNKNYINRRLAFLSFSCLQGIVGLFSLTRYLIFLFLLSVVTHVQLLFSVGFLALFVFAFWFGVEVSFLTGRLGPWIYFGAGRFMGGTDLD